MNMISTGAFQNEMDASNKQNTIVARLVSAWEKKNAKVARAGGVSLMALSLAACGSDDDTTATETTTTTTVTPVTPVTTAPVAPASLTNGTDAISAEGVISAGMVWSPGGTVRVESLQSEDSVTGTGTTDTINIVTDGGTIAPTLTGVETISFALAGDGAASLNLANSTGMTAVTSTSTDGNVSITGLSTGVTLAANSMADAATNAAFQFTTTAVTGATAATINVNGFLGTNLNIGASAAAAVNGTGIETLTLNASGAASSIANLGSSGVTTLNIDADTTLTLSALSSTAITAIDLTGSTGTTSIDVDDNIGTNDFTYTGGAGADTLISNNAFTGTDALTGGAGADTLSIRVASGGGDTGAVGALSAASAAVVSGFETLDMRSVDNAGAGANDYVVDMDHVSGVTAVTMRAGDTNSVTSFTLNDLNQTQAGALTVTHTGTNAATDSEVVVDMKTNGTDTVKIAYTTTADDQVVELNDSNNDIENAEVTLSGSYTTNLDVDVSSFLTSLKVDGGAAAETLTVTNSHTSATVDMSGVASNITATAGAGTQTYKTGSGGDTFTNATGAKTVELGAGNDTFLTTVALITKLDSTIAGDGTDTLKLSTIDTIAATAFASVSGFERLAMDQTNLGGDKTFDMANLSDSFSRVSIGATNDKVVTLDNVDASMNDLRFTKTFAAAAVTTAEAVFDRLTDTTADAVSLNLASGNTIKTLSLLDEETITITVSGAAATGTITTLNVSDVTSMVLSGANTLVITTLAGESKLASIDASGATVAATINAADSMVNMTVTGNANSSGALAITTGAGTDTITGSYTGDTLSGGIGNDTISGLSGADTIDGDGGNDTLTGGGAADTFRIAEGTDTITDFSIAGGDKLSIDVSGVEARAQDGTAIDWVQVDKTAASVGNTDVLKGSLITGAIDLNTLTGNENMLVLNGTVATSALGTVIGTGGTFAVTHETTIADNDGFLVLHTDGTNAYLQLVSLDGTAVTNGNVMAPAVIGTNLITTLTGVTDLSGWTTANEVASVA
jgi:hypothetical protein